MSKKKNEALTRILRSADPVSLEGTLPEADAARMRRRILAEAAASESATGRQGARPGLFWIPAAAAAALAVGLGLVLFFALTTQDRPDGDTVAVGDPLRALLPRAPLLRTNVPPRPTGEAPAGSALDLPALAVPAEPPPFPPSSFHRAPAPRTRPVRPAGSPIAPSAAFPSGRASLPAPPSAPAPEPAPAWRAAAARPSTGIERFPSSLPEPARLARAEPPSIENPRAGKPPRRLNLTAPGGTRLLWVIDPELDIDSTDSTETTFER